MKKIYFLLATLLLSAGFSSCQKEPQGDENDPQTGGKTLFSATVEALKNGVDAEATNDFWSPGDKINVVLNDNTTIVASLIAGQGTEEGSFMGTMPEGKTASYAVYPEVAFESVDGDALKLIVPSTQYGNLIDCKVAAGKVEVGNKVALKNLTAVLPVNILAGADVCKVELTSVDGSTLAGVVPVTFSESGLEMGAIQDAASTVSVDVYGAGTYNFAVIPGAHAQGLKVSWYLSENPSVAAGEIALDETTFAANTLYEAVQIKTVDRSLYVTVSGAGTMDGKSWENALSATAFIDMLKAAVYVAPEEPADPSEPSEPALANEDSESTDSSEPSAVSFNGATFHFAAGTYDFGEASSLTYNEVVTLEFIGGYDATGKRDVENNVTTFTGNKSHQIFDFGTEMQCKFDGINFVDGYVANGNGGALSLNAGTWEFTDCNFSGNEVAGNGGALYFSTAASVTFDNCDFTNNTASNVDVEKDGSLGGAIYCGSKTSNLVMTINGGTISGNTAWRGGFMCSYGAKATISNVTFTGNEVTRGGGAIYTNSSGDLTLENCAFNENMALYGGALNVSSTVVINNCTFEGNQTTGNAGAITVGNKGVLKLSKDAPTTFKNNRADKYGGALEVETFSTSKASDIEGAIFVGNSANWGGAVAVYGKTDQPTKMYFKDCVFGGNESGAPNSADTDGGAFYLEDASYVNLTRVSLIGNYAANNGGAIAIHGWEGLELFQTTVNGNYAKSGGAIYTEGSGENYAYLYIDECSFDANHISSKYGTTMNVNGITEFCMNNTSVKGSYCSKSRSGAEASWIAMDVVQNLTSISNCSIIGNTQYSSDGSSFTTIENVGLIGLWGNNHYFTNNIIVPESAEVLSILGSGADKVDLTYNHYNSVSGVEATDNGGNTKGHTSADFGSPAWTDGCWMWNGQINGVAPTMMTQETVLARLNAISPAFVEWCGGDINMDQLYVDRGAGSWWPGAYQQN